MLSQLHSSNIEVKGRRFLLLIQDVPSSKPGSGAGWGEFLLTRKWVRRRGRRRRWICSNAAASGFVDPILIRSNNVQQYTGIYLLQNYCTCFGCPSHPSSGVHKTVTAASGTDHSNSATTFLQRDHWPRRRKLLLRLRPVPEAAVTVLCTPDDGCDGHAKYIEWICSK